METYKPVFSPEEEKQIEAAYQGLREAYLASNHRKKVEVIDKAFNLARVAHGDTRRRSGEPYILHPIAVARIVCSEMGLGSTSISAALMHDVVEDTEYTEQDIARLFGNKMANIIVGLTKISGKSFEGDSELSLQAENFRKLLLTMSDDARIVLIKLADRLHNMRTLGSMLPAKQYKIAGETQSIYAPLAHRLGLYAIKAELEDLSFKYELPEEYARIKRLVEESESDRQELLTAFIDSLRKPLDNLGITYEIHARVKALSSIWGKMQKNNIPFEEVYDLYAVRIVFEMEANYAEKNRSFDIYNAITSLYRTNGDRIRDWISQPKPNGYQALHMTVMGPMGKWVEVQIRSRRMDDIAEYGLASHWRYKTDQGEDKILGNWLDNVRDVLQDPTPSAMDFLDNLRLSFYTEEITVYTPKGKSIPLPLGASVLDMAYAIHSELGNSCLGGNIQHRAVPMSTKLKNGDQVEILTSPSVYPKPEWQKYVITIKARLDMNKALRRRGVVLQEEGKERVRERLEELGRELNDSNIDRLLYFFRFTKREDFFLAVASGEVNLEVDLSKPLRLRAPEKPTGRRGVWSALLSPFTSSSNATASPAPPQEAERDSQGVINPKSVYPLREIEGKLNYSPAPCCQPIKGDSVLGVLSEDATSVVVHKVVCPVATRYKSLHGNRLLSVEWGQHGAHLFEATLLFNGEDSLGILQDITRTLAESFGVNITKLNIAAKDGLFAGEISLLVHGREELDKIITLLLSNHSIMSVSRAEPEP